jgi:hypothetical protein
MEKANAIIFKTDSQVHVIFYKKDRGYEVITPNAEFWFNGLKEPTFKDADFYIKRSIDIGQTKES